MAIQNIYNFKIDGNLSISRPFSVDTDTTLSSNSDKYLPTQKAVKTYVDNLPTYYTRDAVNGILQPRTSTDKEYLFNNKHIYSNSDDALIKNLSFYKSRGTYASPSVITTGDYLGEIVGYGHDGSNYIRSASIRFKSAGTITGTRIPSQIEFWTSTNATPSVETLRGTISNTGVLNWIGKIEVDGSINLNTTDALGAGTININGNRYFHAYSPAEADTNLFIGFNSGNFTLTSSSNTSVGRLTLNSLTSGFSNTAIGRAGLNKTTSGSSNISIGHDA